MINPNYQEYNNYGKQLEGSVDTLTIQDIAKVFQKVFPPSVNRRHKPLSQIEPPLSAAKKLELEQKAARVAAHEKLFNTIKELYLAGTPILAIARRLKMSRNTVKKFLAAESAPPRPSASSEIFADSSVSALFAQTMDRERRTQQSRFMERNKTTR